MKPVLFVTGHVAPDRAGAFACLHERAGIELALYGGRHRHGAAPAEPPPGLPHRYVSQREVGGLVASGAYRAVVVGTGGRIALPTAWRAARRAGVPFVFWAALWRTPRTVAHLAARGLMARIYRDAAAVVTYGEHVSAYVRSHGATRVFTAPQAVDNAFWGAPATPRSDARFAALFVGRPAREKGLATALEAWRSAALDGTFTVVGEHRPLPSAVAGEHRPLPSSVIGEHRPLPSSMIGEHRPLPSSMIGEHRPLPSSVIAAGVLDPPQMRNLYAACDVLLVPSIVTRQFIEPWGLVVNEAMNQGAAIICSDAVGAAAGGLVRHGHNGLIVAAGDSSATAQALAALAADRERCAAMGAAGRSDVAAYTFEAWANGFVQALELSVSTSPRTGSVTQ